MHDKETAERRRRAELLSGVYVILDEHPRILELADAVLAAGVRIVQYRAKSGIRPQTLGSLRARTAVRGALLILNDDWRAANEFDCDGVHLGPADAGFDRPALVRAGVGDRLIGLSCGTPAEARHANESDVDYIGVGSIYATSSKSDAGPPIGTFALRALVDESRLPVAAIGGITAKTLAEIRRSGAAMAAVISAISSARDPEGAARRLIEAWRN